MVVIIDFETYSEADLSVVGSARYAADPSTSIICLAACNTESGEEELWRPSMGTLPRLLVQGFSKGRTFVAHNAGFDRRIWREKLPRVPLPALHYWQCSAFRCSLNGLPRDLDTACLALFEEYAKDPAEAKALKTMMKPQRGKRVDTPELRALVEHRAIADVRFAARLMKATAAPSEAEQAWWVFDQTCNDRGIPVDLASATAIAAKLPLLYEHIQGRLNVATGFQVESVTKLKKFAEWLSARGVDLHNMARDTVEEALKTQPDMDPMAREALTLKMTFGLAAPKKFPALVARAQPDEIFEGQGVICDTYVVHGAHTGRDTSKGLQTQNLKRATASEDELRALLEAETLEDLDLMVALGDEPLEVAGESVRLMVRANPGHKLLVGDFSKIETCVLFWIAGIESGLQKIRDGVDLYCDLATTIFKRPITKADAMERQVGKHGILGLGFGCGEQRYQDMVFELSGLHLPPGLSKRTVDVYRKEMYPGVPRYWYSLEGAVRQAIVEKRAIKLGKLAIISNGRVLGIRLPSGRMMRYQQPRVSSDNKVVFHGIRSKTKQWGENDLWGGTITENIVQAVANDLMREAALRLDKAGFSLVMRSHDELVAHEHEKTLDEFTRIMSLSDDIGWWGGCPIGVESKEMVRYSK